MRSFFFFILGIAGALEALRFKRLFVTECLYDPMTTWSSVSQLGLRLDQRLLLRIMLSTETSNVFMKYTSFASRNISEWNLAFALDITFKKISVFRVHIIFQNTWRNLFLSCFLSLGTKTASLWRAMEMSLKLGWYLTLTAKTAVCLGFSFVFHSAFPSDKSQSF